MAPIIAIADRNGNADRAVAVEASRQHDRLASHVDQFVLRSSDAGLAGQPQRDLLPGLHAVVVGLLRKFRDGEVAMLVDDRRLRPRAAERGAGGEDELKVFVRFLVPENALGDLEQPAEFDQGRNAGADRRLERFFADPAEAERAEPRLVGDAEQIVAFGKRANGAAFSFGEAAFGALH